MLIWRMCSTTPPHNGPFCRVVGVRLRVVMGAKEGSHGNSKPECVVPVGCQQHNARHASYQESETCLKKPEPRVEDLGG